MNRDILKGARFAFYMLLFFMGGIFWVTAKSGHFAMSPELYGEHATELPATIWAGCMMFPAAVYLGALFVNGRQWWTVYVRLIVGSAMVFYFSAFMTSTFPMDGVNIVEIGSLALMIKAAVMTYFDGLDFLRQKGAKRGRA